MTLDDLLIETVDNVEEAGRAAPSRARVLRALQRAKDECFARLEVTAAPDILVYRVDIPVAAGAASVSFPSGSVAGQPAPVRLIGVSRVDGTIETPLRVLSQHERAAAVQSDSLWRPLDDPSSLLVEDSALYVEGATLRFTSPGGAPAAMTIRLRYTAIPQDWAAATPSAELDRKFAPLEGAIVALASADLIPAGPASLRWASRAADRLAAALDLLGQVNRTEPLHIKMVP